MQGILGAAPLPDMVAREYALSVQGRVGYGETIELNVITQNFFRMRRLVIPALIAEHFAVMALRIGGRDQFGNANGIPGGAFSETSVDSLFTFDSAAPQTEIRLTVKRIKGKVTDPSVPIENKLVAYDAMLEIVESLQAWKMARRKGTYDEHTLLDALQTLEKASTKAEIAGKLVESHGYVEFQAVLLGATMAPRTEGLDEEEEYNDANTEEMLEGLADVLSGDLQGNYPNPTVGRIGPSIAGVANIDPFDRVTGRIMRVRTPGDGPSSRLNIRQGASYRSTVLGYAENGSMLIATSRIIGDPFDVDRNLWLPVYQESTRLRGFVDAMFTEDTGTDLT